MFEVGGVYKHDSCLDMMIQVVGMEDEEHPTVLYTNGWRLFFPEPETVFIPRENWSHWKRIIQE